MPRKKAPTVSFPDRLVPMSCTITRTVPGGEDWIHEVKWDGYRIVAYKHHEKINLKTRGLQDYSKKYSSVIEELKEIHHDVILDGELVVLGEDGKPKFNAMQNYDESRNQVGGHLVYYCFDILWMDGEPLTSIPLLKRKEILRKVLEPVNDTIRYSDHFTNGKALLENMKRLGLEGIVSKKANSTYIPGDRSKNWLKHPLENVQEFIIGGWTESEKSRHFKSLLFGQYNEAGQFMYVGHAGGGYTDLMMKDIYERIKKLEIKKKPFANEVETDRKTHWIKPELVADIKFASWTESGKIRKPAIFKGFREDKKVKDLQPDNVEAASPVKKQTSQPAPKSTWNKIDKVPIESSIEFTVNKHTLQLNNLDKEIWASITKADLIKYYADVFPYIKKHICGRPLSIHIKHKGVHEQGMYLKGMEGRQPDWAEVYITKRKKPEPGKSDIIDYIVVNEVETLLWVINLDAIDVNPMFMTTKNPAQPDYMVIDLDPSDNDFAKTVPVAQAIKKYCVKHGLKAFPKTSGKTGMHIYIPCAGFDFTEVKAIAKLICEDIHEILPELTTIETSVSSRNDNVYLDYTLNDYGDTMAAVYSVRPYHSPTVSTPLDWREVTAKLDPAKFTIHTVLSRLKKKGDLFADVNNRTIKARNSKILRSMFIENSKQHAA